MKSNKKALLTGVCVVTLVAASVIGTFAYFTDKDQAVNTFIVGQVEIELDESDVKTDGTKDTEERVTENIYHLLPGHTYIKDPTVHVDSDSEDCYVFVTVDNGIAEIEADSEDLTQNPDGYTDIENQMKNNNWKVLKNENSEEVKTTEGLTVYVYAVGEASTGSIVEKDAELVVFEKFMIDGDSVEKDDLTQHKDAKIVVKAFAVQANGFTNAYLAWKAAFVTNP